jgi:hypothetical protein
VERGFKQSDIDPCLFMKNGCIFAIYVDATIFGEDEHQHLFQLRDEGEAGDLLQIRITKQGNTVFLLTQT